MILQGDCLEVLPTLESESIDSIVTDPPYGLTFMGKHWDKGVPGVEFWQQCFRVAKPGTHLLAFGGTRTYHRLACAIEDAGWEIRDCIMWIYGSGFPKSHDVSKAIDKQAGATRKVVGTKRTRELPNDVPFGQGLIVSHANKIAGRETAKTIDVEVTEPATQQAKAWDGWGTALKPAHEPIILARKPLKGTVANNVLANGTGAINIDGCRVEPTSEYLDSPGNTDQKQQGTVYGWANYDNKYIRFEPNKQGRFPANVIHDGSSEVVELFPHVGSGVAGPNKGSAARFFYCAKASKRERGEYNTHPTVKPLALLKYLCRLVTPPNGLVLDPFAGSGSTGLAAIAEGFRFQGIELEPEYVEIAKKRLAVDKQFQENL